MRLKTWLAGIIGIAGIWQWQRQQERSQEISIANKVVIITGASSGIGRACAHIFAVQGAHVVLVARRANLLAEVQEELKIYGTRTLSIPADLSNDNDIAMIVTETVKTFGRVDVLVNNAGQTMGGLIETQSKESIRQMIDVNLYGAIHLTQAVVPIMKTQQSGHIVNVSSVAGVIFAPGQSSYSATKAGLNAFSDSLRRELGQEGIRISIVMPSWTYTDMIADADHQAFPGIQEGWSEIESPEYVASNIVGAVRYNKKRVVLGGLFYQIGELGSRVSPTLADLYFRYILRPDYAEKVQNLG